MVNEIEGSARATMDLLRSLAGDLILSAKERTLRWKKHFEMLLNTGARGDEEESQLDIGGEDLVDEPLPSELDVRNAIKKIKCNKAAEVDGIFAVDEIL